MKFSINLSRTFFFIFFVIFIFIFIALYNQYNYSKEILIQNFINKHYVYSLKIKERFKTLLDRIQFYLKTMEDENLRKLEILQLLYRDGAFDATKGAEILNEDKSEIGHYEVFIIDKNHKIIDGSFKPDIGLDLGVFKIYKDILDSVFEGKKRIDISYPHLDTYSMNVKKYYLIRSSDGKYLLELAYVIDVYDLIKKIYKKILEDVPDLEVLDIFFIEKYMIIKMNFGKKPSKKMAISDALNMSYNTFIKIAKDIGFDEKIIYKMLISAKKNKKTISELITELFNKKDKIVKLDIEKNRLIIYNMINGVFDNSEDKLIVKSVYSTKDLSKNIAALKRRFLLTFFFVVFAILLVYFCLIFRISNEIAKIIQQMKKNEAVEINTFIKEIKELKDIYNEYRDKLSKEIEKNVNLLNENKRFIVDTIHQIKTPISVITLNLDYIKHKVKDKAVNEILDEIEAAVTMLTNSYEDLSYISGNGVLKYEAKEEIDISALTKDRIHFFMSVAKANDKKIVSDIEDCLYFKINKIEFERIVDNNLSNAIKYSKQSEIKVSLKKEQDKMVLKFESFGDRIKAPVNIFNKNYREHSHKRGLGIGLNIVKEICDKYHIEYQAYYENGKNIFEYVFKS